MSQSVTKVGIELRGQLKKSRSKKKSKSLGLKAKKSDLICNTIFGKQAPLSEYVMNLD